MKSISSDQFPDINFHSSVEFRKSELQRNLALYFLRDYFSVTLTFDSTPNFPPKNFTTTLSITRESFL